MHRTLSKQIQPDTADLAQLKHLYFAPPIVRYRVDSFSMPLTQDALPFAEQIRRALIRNRSDTTHSEAITGKTIDGVPLVGHEHAHYLPTDEDDDGRLDHITVYCPHGFDEADVEALGSLRTIYRRGNRPDVRLALLGLESLDGGFSNSSSFVGQIFTSSNRWRSVTPFSLPRFPYRKDGKPRPSESPEAQLLRELRVRGLPEPIKIKRIDGYQPNARPLVRWVEFHTQRHNGTSGKGLAGFEIEFGEPVAGPLALGFGCHFGLGLFLPC